jgi:hypothetical protein
MSSTTTQTQTQPEAAQVPNITIITRVASIPMISSGLGTINDALTANVYARSPSGHAKAISTTAYKLTEPIQTVLAPLITKADGIANMAVDPVESRYPYPFKAQPVDEKVRTPAFNVAHDIDQVSLFVSSSLRRTHNIFSIVFCSCG